MQQGWSRVKLAVVLYPFAAGAMAVNVFFASLIGSWVGLPVVSATIASVIGAFVGLPAVWWFAGHIRHLMDKAND